LLLFGSIFTREPERGRARRNDELALRANGSKRQRVGGVSSSSRVDITPARPAASQPETGRRPPTAAVNADL